MSRRARPASSRRFLAAVVGAALFAAGCFPPGSGGSLSGHHNDPFLTCVRQHESGDYKVDSPGGQYHGAYQFLQGTWDLTAKHIGANDQVGVDPHTASPTVQDDMAWALYQWQGPGPWGDSGC